MSNRIPKPGKIPTPPTEAEPPTPPTDVEPPTPPTDEAPVGGKKTRKVRKAYTPAAALAAIEKLRSSATTADDIAKEIAEAAETVEARAEAAAQAVRDEHAALAATDPAVVAARRNGYVTKRIESILATLDPSQVDMVRQLAGL